MEAARTYPVETPNTNAASPSADIEKTLAGLADQAMKYAQSAQDAIQNVRPFLDKSLKEQPMQTLAAIAAVGFVLGAIWKR